MSAQKKLLVCGSKVFDATKLQYQQILEALGVPCVVPVDPGPPGFDADTYRNHLSRTARSAMDLAMDPGIFGLLAVNLNKGSLPRYIGPGTFAQVAAAFLAGKKIYLLTDVPGFCAQELHAWAAVPLRGCVDQLVRDYIARKPEVRRVATT